eukprot:360103-Chlamydomonas_euryale.AAC.8
MPGEHGTNVDGFASGPLWCCCQWLLASALLKSRLGVVTTRTSSAMLPRSRCESVCVASRLRQKLFGCASLFPHIWWCELGLVSYANTGRPWRSWHNWLRQVWFTPDLDYAPTLSSVRPHMSTPPHLSVRAFGTARGVGQRQHHRPCDSSRAAALLRRLRPRNAIGECSQHVTVKRSTNRRRADKRARPQQSYGRKQWR